jgi:uncharacterized membrane protein
MPDKAHQELAQQLLGCSYEALNPVQRSVIDLIANEDPTHINPALAHDHRGFGDRLADQVAAIGGSWGFIIAFGVILTVWMGWNTATKGHALAFDPYPFIFLNLMLSMVAAIQAPVIMMSQNRAAARDREAADHDYTVNLRAELEIMHLHDKVDTMREKQMLEMLRQQREALRLLKGQVDKLAARK